MSDTPQGDLFAADPFATGDLFAQMDESQDSPEIPVFSLDTRDDLFVLLAHWQQQGWIRALDLELTRLLAELDKNAQPLALLAVALASHQLGRGHICLDLAATLTDPDAMLSLPPEGQFGEQIPGRPSELLTGLELASWLAALTSSRLTQDAGAPLILEKTRLYLRRQWSYETGVAAGIHTRLSTVDNPPDASAVRTLLDQLFSESSTDVNWQKVACALSVAKRFSIITGGPGTGKTTTVVRLLSLSQQLARSKGRTLRIRLAAPTGKAAARLTESISAQVDRLSDEQKQGVPAAVSTLHRLLGAQGNSRHFRHNASHPLHADLVVVDEASMIDLELFHSLLQALPAHAQLVLLGDKDQLASVEAGAVLGDLCADAGSGGYSQPTIDWLEAASGESVATWLDAQGLRSEQPLAQAITMLRHSHRFGENSGIGALARAVNSGEGREALALLDNNAFSDIDRVELPEDPAQLNTPLRRLILPRDGGYRVYLNHLKQRPDVADFREAGCGNWARALLEELAQFRLLCALRRGPWGVEGINERCIELLKEAGLIRGEGLWFSGRPVMLTRNDYGLGLMNGDIGLTLRVPEEGSYVLRVVFPMADGSLRWILPSRLQAVETVFAMTVHKSQGSEFAHTAMLLPPTPNPVLTRELVYTGITRASARFTLLLPKVQRLTDAVRTPVKRASALRERLLT